MDRDIPDIPVPEIPEPGVHMLGDFAELVKYELRVKQYAQTKMTELEKKQCERYYREHVFDDVPREWPGFARFFPPHIWERIGNRGVDYES